MNKINKAEIINFFMHFCNDMGKAICLNQEELNAVKKWGGEHWQEWCPVVPYGTVGAWQLDFSVCYGGYQIQEVDTAYGGISCPMGHRRFKPTQFLEMLTFARDALRLAKQAK